MWYRFTIEIIEIAVSNFLRKAAHLDRWYGILNLKATIDYSVRKKFPSEVHKRSDGYHGKITTFGWEKKCMIC